MTHIVPTTFVDLLRHRAQYQPDRTAYRFTSGDAAAAEVVSYAELDARAGAIAARLTAERLRGERALLLFQPGVDYLAAFFGCLYAGVIAVPLFPPRARRHLDRLTAIATESGARVALSRDRDSAERVAAVPALAGLSVITTADLCADASRKPDSPERSADAPAADAIAFLQFTSGSTAAPRGVMISHANLMRNAALMQSWFAVGPDDVGVTWLPPYHDMGLIGGLLLPLFAGFPVTVMPPAAFLQRPLRWLEAITATRATISVAPNFAYDLCVQKIEQPENDSLDLACWRKALCGSEPVRPATLARFAAHFSACGFDQEAFVPCYGLAEAALMVAGKRHGTPLRRLPVDAGALAGHRLQPAEGEPGRVLVSTGTPAFDAVAIVDPHTGRRCAADEIGEIWLRDGSVARGYWQRPDESAATFGARLGDEGPFLRTGDLGVVRDGELYVTGRIKELIIRNGRNLYPQDIEATAQAAHPLLAHCPTAVFACERDGPDDNAQAAEGEALIVVQETPRHWEPAIAEAIISAIRQAIVAEHDAAPDAIVLVPPLAVPTTSSGKIARHACRAAYRAGTLTVRAAWRTSVAPAVAARPAPPAMPVASETPALRLAAPSRRGRLRWQSCDLPPPAAGEVEIAVEAAGLNFRDVLGALGLYPGDAGPLGIECAGHVSRVGDGVTRLRPGDAVMAIAQGCFAGRVIADARLVAPKPAPLSFAQAASVPIAYLTARCTLLGIGGLKQGDRVLIHAAAGGVGQAALAFAERAGAEIFATASPPKWEALTRRGIRHVMNSRNLDFSAEIMRRTAGRGVDILLNSLIGEAIPQGLSALAPGGRFIEIGKREIWSEARVAALRPDVSYTAFDLADMARQEPAVLGALLRDLSRQLGAASLPPLPLRSYAAADAPLAFRAMAKAQHVGKIVIMAPGAAAATPDLRAEILAAAPAQRRALLLAHLRQEVARLIDLPDASRIEATRGLSELGLDSLKAVELQARLQDTLGLALPATLAFEHPTLAALVDHVLQELAPARPAAPAAPHAPATTSPQATDETAAADGFDDRIAAVLARRLARLGEGRSGQRDLP